jgi:hypothetical protein
MNTDIELGKIQSYETIPRDGSRIVICGLVLGDIEISTGCYIDEGEGRSGWWLFDLILINDVKMNIIGWWPYPTVNKSDNFYR